MKMKLRVWICVLFLVGITQTNVLACDICGCSLGGNYFGILPQFNKNFVGIRFSQANFYAHMDHNSEFLSDEYSNDRYRTLELYGRFYLAKKWQLMAFLPYGMNTMRGSHQNYQTEGLGDASAIIHYTVYETDPMKDVDWQHAWKIGGGVKLPTGTFNEKDRGILVNPNFQLGTGSTDFQLSNMYTIRYKKWGVNTEVGYKINTRNADQYLFGNQFHAGAQLFYWYTYKSIAVLPHVGSYIEHGTKHLKGMVIQQNTGGQAWMGTAGVELYVKSFSVGVNFKNPLKQQFNSESHATIESKDRWSASITYSF
jgi:hypothetical protein